MRAVFLFILLSISTFAHAQKIKISAGAFLPNYVWEQPYGRVRTPVLAGPGYEFNAALQWNKTSFGLGFCHNKEVMNERVIEQPGVVYFYHNARYERPLTGIKTFVGYGLISKPHWKFGYSTGIVFYRSGELLMHRTGKDGGDPRDSTWSGSLSGTAVAVTQTFHIFYKLNEQFGIFFSPYIENRIRQFNEIRSSILVLPNESSFLWGGKIGVQYIFD